ncbi:MAG: DUF1080 domain-containing protein [Acidobacteria bacterium]|nr:DUF1080 domain-containing protein [Acidobacteriota bacterium]
MQYRWILTALCLCLNILASAPPAGAQSTTGWLAHDMWRPRPPVVKPAPQRLPLPPPADAIVLFDGTNLSNWRDPEAGSAKWIVRNGCMESTPKSGYLVSADAFGDMQLHVEWATPARTQGSGQDRGNSGVFLMGLYEVQVLDSYENETYADGQAAAIYGQHPPLVNASLPPGEWQSYDIMFRRPRFLPDGTIDHPARVTVVHNGILVQDAVTLWGPTKWLQHSPYKSHPDRLPLSLQDHDSPVRFRNIWLRPLDEWQLPAAPPPENAKPVHLSRAELQRYVGRYGASWGEFGSFRLVGNQLQMHMVPGQVIDLVPRSTTQFAMRWTAGTVDFDLNDKGEVAGFAINLGGVKFPVTRMPDGQ